MDLTTPSAASAKPVPGSPSRRHPLRTCLDKL